MDEQRFDRLSRAIGSRSTRRQAIAVGIGGLAGTAAGRSNEASAQLVPCQITCPPIVQGNDPTLCGAMVTFQILPDAGTTCTGIVCNATSGTLFPVGSTPVHCNDIDGRADCDFTITILDADIPVVTCLADVEVTGPDPSTVNYAIPTGTDNCSPVTVVCDPPSGSNFVAGTTVVTCTATDPSNQTSSCEFNITVIPDVTSTPTDTPEPTSTATLEATSTSPVETINPGTETAVPTSTAESTEAPATVAPGVPTATPPGGATNLPNTGAGNDGPGTATKLLPIAVGGAGLAFLARLGLRQRPSEVNLPVDE
jgi:hypothetical protein